MVVIKFCLTLVVDAVCAAFFRTKRRHLNASESRTNGNNCMLWLVALRVNRNIIGVYPRALSANLADREHRTLMRRDA